MVDNSKYRSGSFDDHDMKNNFPQGTVVGYVGVLADKILESIFVTTFGKEDKCITLYTLGKQGQTVAYECPNHPGIILGQSLFPEESDMKTEPGSKKHSIHFKCRLCGESEELFNLPVSETMPLEDFIDLKEIGII